MDVEDLVAETLQKAYIARQGDRRANIGSIAWLLAIARRTVIVAARRAGRRLPQPFEDYEPVCRAVGTC